MPSSDPRSWLDRLVGLCLSVFVGALALFGAVHLVESVWTQLVAAAIVLALIMVGIGWWREHGSGW
jgi:hypothetical protein